MKNNNPNEFFGIVVQSPDARGVLHDFTSLFSQIDASNSKVVKVVASDLLSLTLVKSPG